MQIVSGTSRPAAHAFHIFHAIQSDAMYCACKYLSLESIFG